MPTDKDIKYIQGSNKVLVTAPHAYAHRRPNYSGALKQPEPWTDKIAQEISEKTGSHILIATTDLEYDPNYHLIQANPFKEQLTEIVKVQKIKYLFDIHGLSNEYPYDFGLYFANRYHKSKQTAYDLSHAINSDLLKRAAVQIICFNTDLQETLSEYAASELKTASVQVEITRFIREDRVLRDCLIDGMSRYILQL